MRLYTYLASLMIILAGLILIPLTLANITLDSNILNLLLVASILTVVMIIVDEILIKRDKVSSEGEMVDVFGLDETDWKYYHGQGMRV